ncbi:MAG: hypothetical protein QOE71_2143 [Pseudonocardiales bacterium]|nr:hypothetical protein [Pseudonocardiales bacterium]
MHAGSSDVIAQTRSRGSSSGLPNYSAAFSKAASFPASLCSIDSHLLVAELEDRFPYRQLMVFVRCLLLGALIRRSGCPPPTSV